MPRLVVLESGRVRVINIVMHIGMIGESRAGGQHRAGALGDGQKLQSNIILLGAALGDGPDRIVLQQGVALDGRVEIALELCDRHPGSVPAPGPPLIGDAPVVGLVRPLEGEQSTGGRHLSCGGDEFADIRSSASQAPTEAAPRFLGSSMKVRMGISPSIPALNHRMPRYPAQSIVFGRLSPRTEIAEFVPMESRKSLAGTAVDLSAASNAAPWRSRRIASAAGTTVIVRARLTCLLVFMRSPWNLNTNQDGGVLVVPVPLPGCAARPRRPSLIRFSLPRR